MDGLAYRLAPDPNGRAGDGVRLEWLAGSISANVDDLLRQQQENQRDGGTGKLQAAKELWRRLLAEGPCLVKEIEQRARQAGISESTLNRARWDLGVECHRQGFGAGSKLYATLPNGGMSQ